MRRFIMYRKGDLSKTHNKLQVNPSDEPQFQGIVFDDGICVIRWLTGKRSTSVWDNLKDMLDIHGHPEYDSELIWLDKDENVEVTQNKLTKAQIKMAVSFEKGFNKNGDKAIKIRILEDK